MKNLKALKDHDKNHKAQVDADLKAAEINDLEKSNSLRARRRQQSQTRKAIGFKEPEEEDDIDIPEDPVMEQMDNDAAKYERFLADSKNRKTKNTNVKLATEIRGIGKKEQDQAVLRSGDLFKEAP